MLPGHHKLLRPALRHGLCLQLVNLGLFLLLSAVQYADYCNTFNELLGWVNLGMWTLWNTVFAINVMQIRLVTVWQRACAPPALLPC